MSSAAVIAEQQHHADALDRRRLQLVVAQASPLLPQILATSLVIVALSWGFVPWPLLLGWLLAVPLVRQLRVHWLRRWSLDTTVPVRQRMPAIIASSAVFGSTCGAASLFMLWLGHDRDALLTMIMMSWAAGAVSTTAPLLGSYLMYSACLYVPAALMWLIDDSPLALAVTALILMFAGVQYRFAKQNAAVFEESFRIRRDNEILVQQLGAARDRAESAVRAKSRFLAAASHDLRQPLHALTLQSGLLALDPRADNVPRIVGELSTSIDSLGRLLDSLLDISKLDAGVVTVSRRRIVLARLFAQLVQSLQPQAEQKGLKLRQSCAPDLVIDSDPLLLERLLRNLLDNALKYSDHGEIWLTASGDTLLELSVRDSGRGIPAEAQQQVFEEFYQLPDPTLGAGPGHGLGLGLAIVQRLAALLEMPLQLQSAPGVGTTVSLQVPRAAPALEETAAPQPGGPSLRGLKVLLVDDEPAIRHATRAVLEHFGCTTFEAGSSEQALAQARQQPPDLVLADYQLGHQDTGIETVARLRELLPGLPAVLVTGDTATHRLREAERSGLLLLHKPVTVARLGSALQAALDSRADPPAGDQR